MIVQLSIEVKKLLGFVAGRDFAEAIAAHLHESFNDDGSLGAIHWKLLAKKKTGRKVKR